MKKIILTVAAAMLTGVLLSFVLSGVQRFISEKNNTVQSDESIALQTGCIVKSLFAYSDENNGFDNVAAIKLENNSDVDYRCIEIKVETDNGEYLFLASVLPAHKNITVLEENGAVLEENPEFRTAEIAAFEVFEETPSLMEDKFSVEIKDGSVEIKNISGEDINKNINIYIKATDDFGYFGGMTYKLSVGTLKADETKTIDIDMPVGENPQAVFIAFDNES